jgi:AcrR family transcriptional regulator
MLTKRCYALQMTARTLRARVRKELTSEIKAIARRQLAAEGANLSLRAIARELGMVSSAVYRYFPSRDDLLTALIIDCYNELGEATEHAVGTVDPADFLGRWLAFGHGIRDWALTHPSEYALIYGSPVPGYQAPQDTIGPASRTTTLILDLLSDGVAAGLFTEEEQNQIPEAVRVEMARVTSLAGGTIPESVMVRGVTAWVQVFGMITFELFGRFANVLDEHSDELFDYQLRMMAEHVGLAR